MGEKDINASEIAKMLGSRGGQKTLKKYGRKHYQEMIKKRWDNVKKNSEIPQN